MIVIFDSAVDGATAHSDLAREPVDGAIHYDAI